LTTQVFAFSLIVCKVVVYGHDEEIEETLLNSQLCIGPVIFIYLVLRLFFELNFFDYFILSLHEPLSHVQKLSKPSRENACLWFWQRWKLFLNSGELLLSVDIKDDNVVSKLSGHAMIHPNSAGHSDYVRKRGIEALHQMRR